MRDTGMALDMVTHPPSSLNPPTQSTSIQTSSPTPPTSFPASLVFQRLSISLLRHTTMTLVISHFYMLEVDYLSGRYLVFQGGISEGENS
jgi:hypothetical protein